MNSLLHPIMQAALAPAMIYQRTQTSDRLRAKVVATADLNIGRDGVVSIEGTVWVYREDSSLCIDDIEIEVVGTNRSVRTIGIGTHHDTMRFRALTHAEMQEHVIACAFHDLVNDERFVASAEIALEKASRP